MTENINVPRLICLGMTKLGYREAEMLHMTPRKFFLLYDEFLIASGLKKEESDYAIDNL